MKMLRRCMIFVLCIWVCTVQALADTQPTAGANDAAMTAAAEAESEMRAARRTYDALAEDAAATYESTTKEASISAYEVAAEDEALSSEEETASQMDYEGGIVAARSLEADARASTEVMRVPIVIDGKLHDIRAYLFADGVSYLSLREAAALLFPNATIGWDAARSVATLKDSSISLIARWGQPYIEANGRYFALSGLYPANNLLISGVTYVPLRNLARAAGASVGWNTQKRCAELTTKSEVLLSGTDFYDTNDVYWLSKIIYAESGDQSLRGQLAVGAVILNRQAHAAYPDTVYGVIFDRKYGVQFTPTVDGAINKTPSEQSIIAAKLVLDGCMISKAALYFLDPSVATSFWIVENCEYLFTIGCHDFYI